LNTATAPFDNKKVRQAIGMAIDKVKIVTNVMKGEAYSSANNGIVPSAINGYDFSSVVGLEYNLTNAKKLLAEAGYPGGKGFPTITLASLNRNTTTRVILEIQKQLLVNLNINVEISSLTSQQIMEMNGKSELNMSLGGWLGEFPDPVTFLSLFYGADVPSSLTEVSFPNESRYKNAAFDKLYEKALITIDDSKRYELCLKADQIIATDVPGIPLWYHENYQLIKSNIAGYQENSMNIKYLVHVKIEESLVVQKNY
jgi:ABC-type transport system substrate-binding protein